MTKQLKITIINEALDEWLLNSDFVKNIPDYKHLPNVNTVKNIDTKTLQKAIDIAKKSKEINLDSTHADHINLLIKVLGDML